MPGPSLCPTRMTCCSSCMPHPLLRHKDAHSAVDRGAAVAGAAAAEALAKQCHRFRLSVDVHSVQARRLPTSLASVYATATLPPELPGVQFSSARTPSTLLLVCSAHVVGISRNFHQRLQMCPHGDPLQ